MSPELSTVIVSNVGSFAAILLAIRLGLRLWKDEGPALLFAAGFALFPANIVLSFGYSESLFLCLFLGTLLELSEERIFRAGVWAGLAAITRPQGIWLAAIVCAAVAWENWKARGAREALAKAATCAVPCAIPFVGFMGWEWVKTGNPAYFLHLEGQWNRHFDFVQGLMLNVPSFDKDWLLLLVSLAAWAVFFRRAQLVWKVLSLTSLAMAEVPLFFGGYLSYFRFVGANLAVFALLAEAGRKRPWIFGAYLIVALTMTSMSTYYWLSSNVNP